MKAKNLLFLTVGMLVSSFLIVQAACAGLVIERERTMTPLGQNAVSHRQVSYFQANRVKTVSQDGTYAILDLQKGTMTMVDPAKKEYSVTSLKEMLGRMETGMNKLKEKFNALPPEQRAMVEQMMGGKKTGGESLEMKDTGKKEKIAGYVARKFVILKNGKPLAEYWVSEGLKKDILEEIDKSKLDEFEQAMKKISSEGMPFANSEATQIMKLEQKIQDAGEVVKEVHYARQAGPMSGSSSRVVSVKKAKISASEFEIPGGYKKVADPMKQVPSGSGR